jgi:hypothetical protein
MSAAAFRATKHVHLLCILCICFLTACESNDELLRSYPGETPQIEGFWLSNCHLATNLQALDKTYLINSYVLSADGTYKLNKSYYSDSECHHVTEFTFDYVGTYTTGEKVIADDGLVSIHIELTSRNPNWPKSIASLFIVRVVRLSENKLFFGHYNANGISTMDYDITYIQQTE